MCKNCYNSPLGIERRREQNEAAAAFKGQQFKGYQDPAYLAASKRCIDAGKAMAALHSDYVWEKAREQAGIGGSFYTTYVDKRDRHG